MQKTGIHGISVSQARIRDGAWHAIIVAPAGTGEPALKVLHDGQPLDRIEVTPEGEVSGLWLVRVPIPAAAICEGVQTFIVCEAKSEAVLDRFTLVTGKAAAADLNAEVEFLRAELDLLKSAFRQHCAERDEVQKD